MYWSRKPRSRYQSKNRLCPLDTGKITKNATSAGVHRRQIAARDLRKWLKQVGLTYHSPHKFRHGHAVYALKMTKDVSALKAVSQNLMHENLSITDGVYGILSDRDVMKKIAELGKEPCALESNQVDNLASLIRQLEQSLQYMNENDKE
jgi:integrase